VYEEYYCSLLGATGKRREFQLLRSLVDSGNASWIDGRLTINIRRIYLERELSITIIRSWTVFYFFAHKRHTNYLYYQ